MTQVMDTFEIDDPHVFEVLNNPLRLRILRQMGTPRSVKQVADALDVPTTRLYYHVNLLEDVGVINVAETRKVGAMIEKLYLVAAHNFRPSKKLMDGGHDPNELARVGISVVLDGARLDGEAALVRHFEALAADQDSDIEAHGALGRTIGYFTAERAKEFSEKIQKLLENMADRDNPDEGVEYGFSYVFFPIAGAERSPKE